jgi:hypothetical protein
VTRRQRSLAITGDKRHVVQAGGLRAGERGAQDAWILIDPDHAAGGADDRGSQHGDVAGTSADVEDPHAGSQSGVGQQPVGERLEHAGDRDQALGLTLITAHQVGGLFRCRHGSRR